MSAPFPVSAIPTGPVPVPVAVRRLAGSRSITPVWRNELGGLTFRLGEGTEAQYVKWLAIGTSEIDLQAEAERLTWARLWITVPSVIDQGDDVAGHRSRARPLGCRSAVGRAARDRRSRDRAGTPHAARCPSRRRVPLRLVG